VPVIKAIQPAAPVAPPLPVSPSRIATRPVERAPAALGRSDKLADRHKRKGMSGGVLAALCGGAFLGVALIATPVVVVLINRSPEPAVAAEQTDRPGVAPAQAQPKPVVPSVPVQPAVAKVEQGPAEVQPVAAGVNPPVIQAVPDLIVAQIPAGPAPATIQPESTRKVKKATVYLKVVMAGGETAEGSGFFAMEPGIVLTNAHVVGMLQANSKAPKKIDIVANSGETDEFTMKGLILGVDRDSDLAVLRVQEEKSRWPAPLPVEFDMRNLTELQKVYIFGFPLGAGLGREITASESSISSFRKDADGSLFQIQVNGGMHPGNSGGPVVDSRGVVVGVAVAIIRGTQINFAVPGDKIRGMVNGRVLDTRLGHPFRDQEQIKLPVKITCLDPLERIRAMQVDVWTGPAGKARPAALQAPAPLAGDGPRQTVAVTYQKGAASQDVVLPTLDLPKGQVYWMQPAFTNQANQKQWGPASTYQPSAAPPLERVAANLTANVSSGERSLKLSSKSTIQMRKGREKFTESYRMNLEVLETLEKIPAGANIILVWGKGQFAEDVNGRKIPKKPGAYAAINSHRHGFQCDPRGALASFGFVKFNFKDRQLAEEANDMAQTFLTSYQFVSLPMPNREVKPLETWDAKIRLILRRDQKRDVMDMVLVCTYEGSRKTADRTEALISLVGEINVLKTDQPLMRKPSDRVTGTALFDVATGQISNLNISLRDERDLGGITMAHIFEADVARTSGNTFGIKVLAVEPAKPNVPPANPNIPPAKGTTETGTGRTRVLGGGFGRDPYTDVAPEGALLVGLEVGLGKFVNLDLVHSIRAVFRAGKKESLGTQHGTNLAKVTRLIAKPGYAVGAMAVRAGANADGLALTFMRIKGDKLDPSDSYESEWIGDPRPGGRTVLTGNGRHVVGIVGFQSKQNNTGIGLLFDRNSTDDDATRPSPVQPPAGAKNPAGNSGGQEFTPKNGQYTVMMPAGARSRQSTRILTIKGQRMPIESAESALNDGTTYIAASIGVPAVVMRQIPMEERFPVFRDMLVKEMRGMVTGEKDIEQGGVAGKEYQIKGGRGAVRMQLYLNGGWVMYALVDGRTRAIVTSTKADAFFSSFKMLDKK